MENKYLVSQCFKALAHKRRVILFDLLLKHDPKKLSFGELQKLSRIPVASLAHHLIFLEKGGLIYRQTKGAHTYFTLQLQSFKFILDLVRTRC